MGKGLVGMKMRKSLQWMIALIMLTVIVLAGCTDHAPNNGSNAANGAKTGDNNQQAEQQTPPDANAPWELGSEPLTFSLYGHYDWYTMPKWEETIAGKWLMENKQVTVEAVQSGGAAAQKLNTMIASGELPDVIWLDRAHDVERLREAGMLVPFDEYLDKYPNLKTWMGEENLNMLRSEDGKLYQFPNWYTGRPFGNAGYVVNKKIYEELGSPPLQTTDDLYDYLKAVKEKYGNQVVPLDPHLAVDSQGLGVLYTAFGQDDEALYQYLGGQMRAVPKDGELTSVFMDPLFRESQKYISKLYREGLIAQDALTQTIDQITERMMQGRTAILVGASPTTIAQEAHIALTQDDPDAGYIMIKPIHKPGLDPDKIYPGTYTSLGWNVAVITSSAADPEKIFAFLDWYTGPEGQNLLFFGPEGQYWDGTNEDGSPIFTDAYDQEAVTKLQADHDPIMWVGNTGYIDPVKAKFEETLPPEKQNWATKWQREITWDTQYNVNEFIGLNPSPDSEEGIIRQRVDDIYLEATAKVLFAKDDAEVDSILDQAEADAQSAGYAKLLEWRTAKWQENLEKMGH